FCPPWCVCRAGISSKCQSDTDHGSREPPSTASIIGSGRGSSMPWPCAGCNGGKSGTLSPNGPAYLRRTKWHGNGRGTPDIFRAATFRELLAYSGFYGPAALLSTVSSAMDRQREGRYERCPRIFLLLSIIGGILFLWYAIRRRDPVFIVGQATGVCVYARNLVLIWQNKTKQYISSASSQAASGRV